MNLFLFTTIFARILLICREVVSSHFGNVDVPDQDSLLCRKCGHDIAFPEYLKNIPSKFAMRVRNDTILGVDRCLIQLLKNPEGQKFELITASAADIKTMGAAYAEHSWFPGYSWRVAVCPQCGGHLGWTFETGGSKPDRVDEESKRTFKRGMEDDEKIKKYSFVGLIFSNLIHENCKIIRRLCLVI